MKARKHLLLAILLLIAFGATALLYTRGDLSTTLPKPTPVVNNAADAQETPQGAEGFNWKFEDAGEGEFGAPRTRVSLIADGKVYDTGTHEGSCAQIEHANLLPDEVSGVLCWWAGAGTEIGIFRLGGELEVRKGAQEEPTAESEGFRGDFTRLFGLQ